MIIIIIIIVIEFILCHTVLTSEALWQVRSVFSESPIEKSFKSGARFTKDLKIILRLSEDNDQSYDIFTINLRRC